MNPLKNKIFLSLIVITLLSFPLIGQQKTFPEEKLIGQWKYQNGWMYLKDIGKIKSASFHIDLLVLDQNNTYIMTLVADNVEEVSTETGKWKMDQDSKAITFYDRLIFNSYHIKDGKLQKDTYQLVLKKASKNRLVFRGTTTYYHSDGNTGVTNFEVVYIRQKLPKK